MKSQFKSEIKLLAAIFHLALLTFSHFANHLLQRERERGINLGASYKLVVNISRTFSDNRSDRAVKLENVEAGSEGDSDIVMAARRRIVAKGSPIAWAHGR